MEGYYHQDERDTAASYGCLGLILIGAVFLALFAVASCTPASAETTGGSAAGANAVTLEDLEREWEEGAYPANGEGAPLSANTTYGRGVGMVDMITYDVATNVEIRHYGQVQEDGTIRWYAAETVIGEDGLPVVMPRG